MKARRMLFAVLLVALAVLPLAACKKAHEHTWDAGTVTTPATCTEAGVKSSACSGCGETKTETVPALGHDWDEGEVESAPTGTEPGVRVFACTNSGCGATRREEIPAYGDNPGDTDIVNPEPGTGGGAGEGFEGDAMNEESYLFIGSSVTKGYGNNNYSIAEMLSEDYIKLSYETFTGGNYVSVTRYLRKISAVNTANADGRGGIYRNDDCTLTLNGDGTGNLNGVSLEYTLTDGDARVSIGGNCFNCVFRFGAGANVSKYAENGYTLNYGLKYIEQGGEQVQVNPQTSYVLLMKRALAALEGEKVDRLFIQLSTNDAGQIGTNFGSVDPAAALDSATYAYHSGYHDDNTTWGALEWMIAVARETWNCEVTVFVCPYFEVAGDYSTNYAMMRRVLKEEIQPKWGVDVLDIWNDEEITALVKQPENIAKYFYQSDRVHANELGYERMFLNPFRAYLDALGEVTK